MWASPASVRRALHRAGFGWKRPKLAPARRRDPHAEAKRERLAAVLADPAVTVVAEDESDSQLLAVVRAMWQRIGELLSTYLGSHSFIINGIKTI